MVMKFKSLAQERSISSSRNGTGTFPERVLGNVMGREGSDHKWYIQVCFKGRRGFRFLFHQLQCWLLHVRAWLHPCGMAQRSSSSVLSCFLRCPGFFFSVLSSFLSSPTLAFSFSISCRSPQPCSQHQPMPAADNYFYLSQSLPHCSKACRTTDG